MFGGWVNGIKFKLRHSVKEKGSQQIVNKNLTFFLGPSFSLKKNSGSMGIKKITENLGRTVGYRKEVRSDGWV